MKLKEWRRDALQALQGMVIAPFLKLVVKVSPLLFYKIELLIMMEIITRDFNYATQNINF